MLNEQHENEIAEQVRLTKAHYMSSKDAHKMKKIEIMNQEALNRVNDRLKESIEAVNELNPELREIVIETNRMRKMLKMSKQVKKKQNIKFNHY